MVSTAAPDSDALTVEANRLVHRAAAEGDQVVSSYTPTLRALASARLVTTARRQLTVALDRTPGQPNLSAIATEATAPHARHPAFRCSPTRTPPSAR